MTSYGQLLERFPYWPALKHSGLLIAPARLAEHFPDEPAPLPSHTREHLRRALTRLAAREASDGPDARAQSNEARDALLDTLLHEVLELPPSEWLRGNAVPARFTLRALTGESLRPRRLFLDEASGARCRSSCATTPASASATGAALWPRSSSGCAAPTCQRAPPPPAWPSCPTAPSCA